MILEKEIIDLIVIANGITLNVIGARYFHKRGDVLFVYVCLTFLVAEVIGLISLVYY
jgi:hypothetical protein